MRPEYKEAWLSVKDRAFDMIKNQPDMWRDWCAAKNDEDRELLMLEAAWHMGYGEASRLIREGGGLTFGR